MNERRCNGTNRRGQPCGRTPAVGFTVCHLHGAKAPQVQRKAAERVAEARAVRMFEQYTPDIGRTVDDPITALLTLAGEISGFKDFIGGRVAEMRAESWRYEGEHAEQLRAELGLYERALDRTARILTDVNKLGLEERRVVLAERQGHQIANALRRIFDALDLTAEQQAKIPIVVPRELRRLSAGETA